MLRVFAGLVMAAAFLATVGSLSDSMDNLGRPEGERTIGALFLVAAASFLIALLAAGMLWVLSEVAEQLELIRQLAAPQITAPLEPFAYLRCVMPMEASFLKRCATAMKPIKRLQANRNSFVLNSLIASRSFAAFSNSNCFAASRISDSSFAI